MPKGPCRGGTCGNVSLAHFDRPYGALVRNRIFPKLLNNAVTGNNLYFFY